MKAATFVFPFLESKCQAHPTVFELLTKVSYHVSRIARFSQVEAASSRPVKRRNRTIGGAAATETPPIVRFGTTLAQCVCQIQLSSDFSPVFEIKCHKIWRTQ